MFGAECSLVMRQGLVKVDSQNVEYVTADDRKSRRLYVILMNSIDEPVEASVEVDMSVLGPSR